MSHYKHISIKEREKILVYRERGYSISKIAQELNRNKSTISRELKRNSSRTREYSAVKAQEKYEIRRQFCKRDKILNANEELRLEIKFLIEEYHWSPEEISNRLKLEGTGSISYITIYRAIYDGTIEKRKHPKDEKGFEKYLRRKGKKRHKANENETRGKIVISNELEDRPQEADNRTEIGPFEADTVVGKKNEPCSVTLVDRKSRYSLIGRAERKNAEEVNKAMIEMLERIDRNKIKTITPDRGKEFANHKEVTEILGGVQFYFPRPHAPWLRGTNENTNGLLREFCPKRKSMKDITSSDFQKIEYLLNTRPRKCLGWRTPYEIFFDELLHLTW